MFLKNNEKLFILKQIFSQNLRFYSIKEPVKHDPEWDKAMPYENIPGPSKLDLIRSVFPGGKLHKVSFVEMNRVFQSDYGDLVRVPGLFGRPDVLLSFNPEIHERVFRTEGIYPIRTGLETFTYYRKNIRSDFNDTGGLLVEEGKKWLEMRTETNPVMLKPQTVRMYIEKVDLVAQDFIEKIKRIRNKETNEMPNTFGHELKKWSLESISLIALDERLGALTDQFGDGQILIEQLKKVFRLSYELEVEISFWKFFSTPKFKQIINAYELLNQTIMKYIDRAVERMDAKEKAGDASDGSVLEKLLAIDRQIAIVMAFDMMLAGVDTTSAVIASCLYHLSQNPDKQARLRKDVMQFLPTKDSKLPIDVLNHVPYMRACIKEALRLNPVVFMTIRAAGQDIVLNGYQVPKGIDIGMDGYLLHYDPKYFPEPNKFIPERWLRDNPDTSGKLKTPFVYLPFGFGPRSCIGKRFAEMEIIILLARIIRNFEVEYHYGPLKYARKTVILSPREDLKFRFTDLSR